MPAAIPITLAVESKSSIFVVNEIHMRTNNVRSKKQTDFFATLEPFVLAEVFKNTRLKGAPRPVKAIWSRK